MKAEFSIKLISYFAPNCPRRIVAPNCPRRIVQRRFVRAELSAPNCPRQIVLRRIARTPRATPSPMSAESDYFENPIQVEKGRLCKSERGPIDIATPWGQPCSLYAAGLGASEGPPACNLTQHRIWVF